MKTSLEGKLKNRIRPSEADHGGSQTVCAGAVDALVARLRPSLPLYVTRQDKLQAKAREFINLFPGQVMYAIKCNPAKEVLQTLSRSGIGVFDVASLEEIALVRRYAPRAKMYFMHPIKSPEAIRAAYFDYGIRAFSLDTQEELYKILRETDLASDLELFVRLALPKNKSAGTDFSCKFGAPPEETAALLRQAKAVSAALGLCFHVGTQTTDPAAFRRGVRKAADVLRMANVTVDALDVGGGFPAVYENENHPSLSAYMQEIKSAVEDCGLSGIPLLCEPGRAMVADAGVLIARVEQRRGNLLYLNDGTYGGLFDAGPMLRTKFPVRLIRNGDRAVDKKQTDFRFAGPTCDSLDMMDGPFNLPDDVRTGDWIEFRNAGSYSMALRSNFNGFGKADSVFLKASAMTDSL